MQRGMRHGDTETPGRGDLRITISASPRRRVTASLLFALLLATPTFGGMTYDFKALTEGKSPMTLAGTTMVEGSNMRIEFTSGDNLLFKTGGVLISKNGGKNFLAVDPKEKTYYDFSLEDLLKGAGAALKTMGNLVQMSVTNQSVNVTELGAGEKIEGYATRKVRVNSSYDLSMKIMGMSTKSSVESTTESWVTNDVPIEYITFIQQKGFKTGFEDLDKLIEAQTGNVKGFPLKQVVTTKNTSGKQSDTSVVTTTVTNFREGKVAASKFEVPADYTKTDNPLDLSKLSKPRS